MGREKAKKRQKRGERSHLTPSNQISAASGFPPFFSHSPEPRLWRGFVPCLLMAFLLRVWVGLSGEFMFRPDEIFQYAEQAHRLVFGYGIVPWEFSVGLRTWLLPAIPAIPMFVGKLLGWGHPDFYIPAVKIWNALLSLVIPSGMYLFGRRIMSESAARLALFLGCFWHEFIIFSTHPVAEQYATVVFFCALVLASHVPSTSRLVVLGVLLGFTMALRLPYSPLVGVVGVFLLFPYSFARWRLVVVGGACALVFWGGVDYLTWGRWWHSPRLFAEMFVFNNIFEDLNYPPFHQLSQLSFLAERSYGLYAATLVALFHWRRHWVLLAMAAAVFIVHLTTMNQEYTNVFVVLPILWMLIATVTHDASLRFRAATTWGVGALSVVVTLSVFFAGVPNPKTATYHYPYGLTPIQDGIFRSEMMLKIARDLASLPAKEVRSVVWVPVQYYRDGAYYYSHHRVPMMFPNRNHEHKQLYESRAVNTLASHVVASSDQTPPGFFRAINYGQYSLFVNKTPEKVDPPANLPTDFQAASDFSFLQRGMQHKVDFPELKERVMLFKEAADHPAGTPNKSP